MIGCHPCDRYGRGILFGIPCPSGLLFSVAESMRSSWCWIFSLNSMILSYRTAEWCPHKNAKQPSELAVKEWFCKFVTYNSRGWTIRERFLLCFPQDINFSIKLQKFAQHFAVFGGRRLCTHSEISFSHGGTLLEEVPTRNERRQQRTTFQTHKKASFFTTKHWQITSRVLRVRTRPKCQRKHFYSVLTHQQDVQLDATQSSKSLSGSWHQYYVPMNKRPPRGRRDRRWLYAKGRGELEGRDKQHASFLLYIPAEDAL